MPRFFGLDIHRKYLEIAAVDNQGKLLFNERVAIDDLAQWAAEHLTQDDAAVLEAGYNTWWAYDTLKPHVGRVVVANPLKTRLIAEARIKTDRLSAEALARLLQANFICEVWVPDEQTREQRALVSHRVFLSRNSTRFKNRLHSILHRYQLQIPQGLNLFSPAGKDWLLAQKLSDFDRLQVENCFDLLFSLQQSQKKVDKALALAARQDKRAAILMQIPGLGFHAALAILSQIGDIRRFAKAKKLCSYAGLVPRVYNSGQKEYTGSITKAGRTTLRWILVEAAHTAARYDPELGRFFRRLEKKKGYNVAIVAVARKMLVIIWHLLSGDGRYRHVKVRSYATKLLNWGYKIGKEQRGQKCGAFVLHWLQQVGLDGQIDQLGTGKNICYLRV